MIPQHLTPSGIGVLVFWAFPRTPTSVGTFGHAEECSTNRMLRITSLCHFLHSASVHFGWTVASVHLCICASVHLCICASVHLCICASVHLCICVSVHLCICASVPMHTRSVSSVSPLGDSRVQHLLITDSLTAFVYPCMSLASQPDYGRGTLTDVVTASSNVSDVLFHKLNIHAYV